MASQQTEPGQNPTQTPDSKEQTTLARTAILTHLHALGTQHLSPLESVATDIISNESQLIRQRQTLDEGVQNLGVEREKLQEEADRYEQRIKETGDLGNWAELLNRELGMLEEVVMMGEYQEVEDQDGWVDIHEDDDLGSDMVPGGERLEDEVRQLRLRRRSEGEYEPGQEHQEAEAESRQQDEVHSVAI